MRIIQNTQIAASLWHELTLQNQYCSPFQTQAYYEFFNRVPGFNADVFAVEQHGKLLALVVVTIQQEKGVKSFFSRRGIIYGGPVLSDAESAKMLMSHVVSYYKGKLIYLETRNFNDYSQFVPDLKDNGWDFIPWLNYELNTTDAAAVNKNMSSSRTRQIKKAIKTGAFWKEAETLEQVKSFYTILELYKNKVKKPLLPFHFFEQFYTEKMGKYLLVFAGDEIIGGIMCPILSHKAIYEFYVCGKDHEFKDYYPSVMATWAAIEYAMQHHIPMFDFMGAGAPEDDYGVREFKARFGGTEVAHGRFLCILSPFWYNTGKLGLKVLSKIKQ